MKIWTPWKHFLPPAAKVLGSVCRDPVRLFGDLDPGQQKLGLCMSNGLLSEPDLKISMASQGLHSSSFSTYGWLSRFHRAFYVCINPYHSCSTTLLLCTPLAKLGDDYNWILRKEHQESEPLPESAKMRSVLPQRANWTLWTRVPLWSHVCEPMSRYMLKQASTQETNDKIHIEASKQAKNGKIRYMLPYSLVYTTNILCFIPWVHVMSLPLDFDEIVVKGYGSSVHDRGINGNVPCTQSLCCRSLLIGETPSLYSHRHIQSHTVTDTHDSSTCKPCPLIVFGSLKRLLSTPRGPFQCNLRQLLRWFAMLIVLTKTKVTNQVVCHQSAGLFHSSIWSTSQTAQRSKYGVE